MPVIVKLPKPRETEHGMGYACVCKTSHLKGTHPHSKRQLKKLIKKALAYA